MSANLTEGYWAIVETWRPVVGFEGLYEVSSRGQVRRVGRAARSGKGRGGGAQIGRVLAQHLVRNGYMAVQLWRDGKPSMRLVHRLVADAFIGSGEDVQEVNHRNGVKAHNHVPNLEWVTRSENVQHAYDVLGRRSSSGEGNGRHRLTSEQAAEVRRLSATLSHRALAARFGVGKSTITAIISGRTWPRAGASERGSF